MKNWRIYFVFLLGLFVYCTYSKIEVQAAELETETVTFYHTDFNAKQGETFQTTLYLEENSNIIEFQLSLLYDTDKVTLENVDMNSSISSALIINTDTDGIINLVFSNNANVTNQLDIVTLTFKVDDYLAAGNYPFLTLNETFPNLAGTSDENGNINDVNVLTDFSQLSIYQSGDVSLDGMITARDATYIKQYVVKLRTLPAIELQYADVNLDGKVNARDAVLIQQKIAQMDVTLGNRVEVTFYDIEGNVYLVKSVEIGQDLLDIPAIPNVEGYTSGTWSTSQNEVTIPTFTNIQDSLKIYAYYVEGESDAFKYYKQQIDFQYSADAKIATNQSLLRNLNPYGSETVSVIWSSSDNSILDSSSGTFTKPLFDTPITLTALISANDQGAVTVYNYHIELIAQGKVTAPSNDSIEDYLKDFIEDACNQEALNDPIDPKCLIEYDLKLPKMIDSEDLKLNHTDYTYFVSVEWLDYYGNPISQLTRSTTETTIDALTANIKYNGEIIQTVYFDEIILTPITEDEVRAYVIDQIAKHMTSKTSVNLGYDSFFNDDDTYGLTIEWRSSNTSVVNIENNVVTSIGSSVPSGTTVSLYVSASGYDFTLEYIVYVDNPDNLSLENYINAELYDALVDGLENAGITVSEGLTAPLLSRTEFVYLDLTEYPEITNLTGISYAKHLKVLNISGLNITQGLSEIASLSELQALVAKDCNMGDFMGNPLLANMKHLKLIDLSHNDLTNLNSIFNVNQKYSKLREIYLNDNQLSDISTIAQAPFTAVLELSQNRLDETDISILDELPFLKYLSLANNQISSESDGAGLEVFNSLSELTELRLQHNDLIGIQHLANLTNLTTLYLGDNQIINIQPLQNMVELNTLSINDNRLGDISYLGNLTNLTVLNMSNNERITSIGTVANLTQLTELYAENNGITTFLDFRNLTSLKKLLLSGNDIGINEDIHYDLENLNQLTTLTLSGTPLSDLSFLENMTSLTRVEISDCSLDAFEVTSSGAIPNQVLSYIDNIKILSNLTSLKYLDISHNDFTYQTGLDFSEAEGGTPKELNYLSRLNKLIVFYANAVPIYNQITTLMNGKTELKYLSITDAGLTDSNWLSNTSDKYIYIDLSGNRLNHFNFENLLVSLDGGSPLQYLYLDSLIEYDININALNSIDYANLLEVSLKNARLINTDVNGFSVDIDWNRFSDTLYYLDISGNYEYDFSNFSIENIKYLNISKINADIMSLDNLNHLETLVAIIESPTEIGEELTKIFDKQNLETLINLKLKGVDVYLYNHDIYQTSPSKEGDMILSQLEFINTEDNTLAVKLENGSVSFEDELILIPDPDLDTPLNEASYVNGFELSWEAKVNEEAYISILSEQDLCDLLEDYRLLNPTLTLKATIKDVPYIDPVENQLAYTNISKEYVIEYIDFTKLLIQYFDEDGSTLLKDEFVDYGSTVTAYSPTKAGYGILGNWYVDQARTQVFDFSQSIVASQDLYIKWDYPKELNDMPSILNENQGNDRIWINLSSSNIYNLDTTLTIESSINEVIITGKADYDYTNFQIVISERNNRLNVKFEDFMYQAANNQIAFDASGVSEDYLVAIYNIGTSKIVGGDGKNEVVGIGYDGMHAIVGNNLALVGNNSTLIIEGGQGEDGALGVYNHKDGYDGGKGGHAIYAKKLEVSNYITLTVVGGAGGNGGTGYVGSPGRDGRNGYVNDDIFDFEILIDGEDGYPGGTGGNGGHGARGGNGIYMMTGGNLLIKYYASVNITGGSSGNGGSGGAGGTGGTGGKGLDFENYREYVGDGGNGGRGGYGGTGGVAYVGTVALNSDTVYTKTINGTPTFTTGSDGTPGAGGTGGTGGAGGQGGYLSAPFVYFQAGENGQQGAIGGNGNTGVLIS